ncbi:MAG: ATP-grasp domain-containing protein, partial [Thermoleophilaceae bacterium]
LMAVSVVVGRDGELVRRFQQVALRTWPADAGISSLAVSVEPDDALIEACRSLLAAAGYWGLAQLQFLDAESGRRLIDVNTRFYGSLALALAAGVDLPPAWHAVTLGRPAGTPDDYRVGVTYRWLEADLMAAMHGMAGRLRTGAGRPRTGPMWSGDDPVSSALFALAAVGGPLRRRLRRADPS